MRREISKKTADLVTAHKICRFGCGNIEWFKWLLSGRRRLFCVWRRFQLPTCKYN